MSIARALQLQYVRVKPWVPGIRATREAASGEGSNRGGRRCVPTPTPLRCPERGRAAQLAPRTAFAALEQARRVRPRGALTRADPAPALLAAPEIALPGDRLPRSHGGGMRCPMPRRGACLAMLEQRTRPHSHLPPATCHLPPATCHCQAARHCQRNGAAAAAAAAVAVAVAVAAAVAVAVAVAIAATCDRRALNGGTSLTSRGGPSPCLQRRARAGRSAPARRRGTQGPWPRASARFVD